MKDGPGFGVHPVYCATGPERCGYSDVLGWRPLNTPVQCPRCGRWSAAVRKRGEIKTVGR